MSYYRHGGYVFREDELAPSDMFNPVVVLPLETWQRLKVLLDTEPLTTPEQWLEVDAILESVEVPK